jgi:MFS family permease
MKTSKKLWNKDFLLLIFVGQVTSLFGNAILRFALPLYILELTGSAATFGMVSALSFLPMVIMSPLGGIIADRVNKKWVIVALDFITTAFILLYIMVSGFVGVLPVTVAMLMILFAIQGMYTPAVQSSVPLLVPLDKLVTANAVVNLVTSLSGMIGPVIGGILFAQFGLPPILYVSGACFATAAFFEMFMRVPHVKQKSIGGVFAIIKYDMADGLRFITKEKPIIARSVAIMFFFNMALSSMILIGLPVLIMQTLAMDGSRLGIAQGALMVGGLVGGVLAGATGKKLPIHKIHWLLLICSVSIMPMGMAFFLDLSEFTTYSVIVATMPITMAAGTLFSILLMSFVQTQTPIETIGKVMSFIVALTLCAQPIGQLLYGALFERFAEMPWAVIGLSAITANAIAAYSRSWFSKNEI